jgi:small subunit ribosomal protein S21
MEERKSQPAWRKDNRQPQDGRGWSRGRRDDRDRRGNRSKEPLPEMRAPNLGPLEVEVYNNDVGQALKILKNRLAKDGILAELKKHKHAEKPGEKKRRKHREALKRMRKSKGRNRRAGWFRKENPGAAEARPAEQQAIQALQKPEKENG